MKKLILIILLVLFSVGFVNADVYVRQLVKVTTTPGQPPKEMEQHTWFGSNKMALVSDKGTIIVDLGQQKLQVIRHGEKKFVEASLPFDLTSVLPEQMAVLMKPVLETMEVTVNPTGKASTVGTWNASLYEINVSIMGQQMTHSFWASPEVPFDWKKYMKLYNELYKIQFRLGGKSLNQYEKIEGYPVEVELNMPMGMSMNTRVTLIDPDRSPPEGIYHVPPGYRKAERLSAEDLQ